MKRIKKYDTTSRKVENPKVSDVGIKKALIIWRSRSVLEVDATKLIFYITTPKKIMLLQFKEKMIAYIVLQHLMNHLI